MKKYCIIITALFFIGINAQNKTSLGLRSGVNFSKITHANLETKTSFYAAAILSIKMSELYTLQPELGYSALGASSKNTNMKDININYITLTVASKFFVKNTGLHFIAAPSLNFDFDDTLIGLMNRDEGNDVTFIDISLIGGIGYDFKNGLGIEARYSQGLIDVYSGGFHDFLSNQLEDEIQYNSVFQIGLTYKFDLSKKDN